MCGDGGCTPDRTGAGDTDWTLLALQAAAASLAGPGTWLLVGMTPGRTGRRGHGRSTSRRFRALASRAVSGCSPKVDSIRASVEQCSNGPSWTTGAAGAKLDTTMAGTRNPTRPIRRM